MKVDRTAFQRPTRIGNRAENFKVCRDRIDSCYNSCSLLPRSAAECTRNSSINTVFILNFQPL